jgi:hypothetical protein
MRSATTCVFGIDQYLPQATRRDCCSKNGVRITIRGTRPAQSADDGGALCLESPCAHQAKAACIMLFAHFAWRSAPPLAIRSNGAISTPTMVIATSNSIIARPYREQLPMACRGRAGSSVQSGNSRRARIRYLVHASGLQYLDGKSSYRIFVRANTNNADRTIDFVRVKHILEEDFSLRQLAGNDLPLVAVCR